jgi:hypothetical protein
MAGRCGGGCGGLRVGVWSARRSIPPRRRVAAWTAGTLDIHQIVTGRGNAAFMMFPDGTTLLLDAGDAGDTEYDRLRASDADQRPDASRTPAQWIARYIRRMTGEAAPRLDYAVNHPLSPDHMGIITGSEPLTAHGTYRLRGLTEVDEEIPIARLMDRGWPDYQYLPPPGDDAMFTNYRRFVSERTATGALTMIGAQAGSTDQITQVRRPDPKLPFEVRVVAVNDRVWTGRGSETKVRFPALASIQVREDCPTRTCAASRFGFATVDSTTSPEVTSQAIRCLEPGLARRGDRRGPSHRRTDVHVVNHQGSIEEENPFWLATLRSRVMILPAWAATHPSADVLKRMLSRRVYPEPRDVFVTLFGTRPRPQSVPARHRSRRITDTSWFGWSPADSATGCWCWTTRRRVIASRRCTVRTPPNRPSYAPRWGIQNATGRRGAAMSARMSVSSAADPTSHRDRRTGSWSSTLLSWPARKTAGMRVGKPGGKYESGVLRRGEPPFSLIGC